MKATRGEGPAAKAPTARASALVSVHDVTPASLPRVLRILELLHEAHVPPPTLLVVPGAGWTGDTLAELRSLVARGHPLAGHGWSHQCHARRTLWHRLHGVLISRDQAEHLSRRRQDLLALVRRCFEWFGANGLPDPELYVPPAWALGALTPGDLPTHPFRWYEDLGGLIHAHSGRRRWLPLLGFEADTRFRQASLRLLNALSVAMARRTGRPLRIALHPPDLDYLMGEDLRTLIRQPWHFVREEEAAG